MMRPVLALAVVFLVAFWVGVVAVPWHIAVADLQIAFQLQEMALASDLKSDLARSVANAKAERERSEQLDEHLAYVRGGEQGLMIVRMVHTAVRTHETLMMARSVSAQIERWAERVEAERKTAR